MQAFGGQARLDFTESLETMTADRVAMLGRLARLIAAGDSRQPFVLRVCEAGKVLVGGLGCSISINSDDAGGRMTVAATDDVAAKLENLQEVLGEGPCHQAYRDNEAVVTALRENAEGQWPEFTRSARDIAGDITIHCVPMRPAGQLFGVFTVYTDDELTEPPELLQFLASAVGIAVLHDPESLHSQGIWATRSVIHQATGMVVVQLAVPPDDALAIIRAHAFAHGATVHEIAQLIVNRRLDFRENT